MKFRIITFYILYPILIFDVLVFNEIIILNFLGLNKYTKKYIMKRGLSENNLNIDEEESKNNVYVEDDD